jgi:hypothetical protein
MQEREQQLKSSMVNHSHTLAPLKPNHMLRLQKEPVNICHKVPKDIVNTATSGSQKFHLTSISNQGYTIRILQVWNQVAPNVSATTRW